MSATELHRDESASAGGASVELKLEAVVIPVSNV